LRKETKAVNSVGPCMPNVSSHISGTVLQHTVHKNQNIKRKWCLLMHLVSID